MEKKEALEIFRLQENVSKEKLDKLYKNLAKEIHPDAHPEDPNAKESFQKLGDAYEVLKKSDKSVEEKMQEVREKAYDEYVEVYNGCVSKANDLGVSLNIKYVAYANPVSRGVISDVVYQKLKETIVADLQILEKNVKAYDSFVNYLKCDINNPLNSSMLEKLEGKRGVLSATEISQERIAFTKEINANYENTLTEENAFFTFQKNYKEIQEYLSVHYGKRLNYKGELNLESDQYSPEIYQSLIEEMERSKVFFEAQKKEEFSLLCEALHQRNIDLNFYLSLRKVNDKPLTYDTLTLPTLHKMLDSFLLMDEIENFLFPLNMTLEKYLKKCGRTIETVTKEELEIMLADLQKLDIKISTIRDTIEAQDIIRR